MISPAPSLPISEAESLLGRIAVEVMQCDMKYVTQWAMEVKVEFPDGAPIVRITPASEKVAHPPNDLLARLGSSAAVMGNLPEDPGYNGSRLIIDDVEAARIAKDIADAQAALSAATRDAERYLDVIFQMADDGWLMHGVEGMSDVQEAVYKVTQEHPTYKERVARSQEGKS